MNDIKILITAAGSPTWPQMANDLHANGERKIIIVGVDMNIDPTMLEYVDSIYQVPAVTAETYVDELINICLKEQIDILIPGISQELEIIEARIDEFKQIGVLVSLTEGEGLKIANNKIKLFDYLKEKKIEIPKYKIANNLADIVKACHTIGYPDVPVCIKIGNGAGSRGVRILDSKYSRFDSYLNEKPNNQRMTLDDFKALLGGADQIPDLMIMDYLPGNEYCVDLLAEKGTVKYIFGQEIKRQAASTPIVAELIKNESAYEIVEKIVKMLKLDGNIGFDFKYDDKGKLWLTEINPRTAQTLSLVTAGGADLLYLRIKQLLGEELPPIDVQYGTTIVRRYRESFYVK